MQLNPQIKVSSTSYCITVEMHILKTRMYLKQEKNYEVREMSQWMKYLPYKPYDLSWIPMKTNSTKLSSDLLTSIQMPSDWHTHVLFVCMYAYGYMWYPQKSDPLQLEFQKVVSYYMGAGNRTQVLQKCGHCT